MLNANERLADCRKRTNRLPLSAAALAGTPYQPDRLYLAELLGFEDVCSNSHLDAVSDRDFAIEFCAVAALTLTHLSRWCEELVLVKPTVFVHFYAGSFLHRLSIMPREKNPDVPGLIRGKSGRTVATYSAS